MTQNNVSVVIPSWNGAKFVAQSLEYLLKLEGAAPEIIVVDHGRLNRETETLCEKYTSISRLRYIGEDHQLGYAGAVNRGVREAKGSLVAVICNDVLVDKFWLKNLLDAFQAEASAEKSPILFSAVHREELPNPQMARTNLWFRTVRPESASPTTQFFHPDGSAFLFDKNVYGLPFDSDYFLYQEDVYLGWKARLMGQEVKIVMDSIAQNFDGGTTRRTPYRSSFLTERNRWINYFSFFSVPTLIKVFPALILDFLIKLLAGKNRLAKLHAIVWILIYFPLVLRKRRLLQSVRVVRDNKILPFLSATYLDRPANHPINRAFAFLLKICGLRSAA